jgi:hypothetical protein
MTKARYLELITSAACSLKRLNIVPFNKMLGDELIEDVEILILKLNVLLNDKENLNDDDNDK